MFRRITLTLLVAVSFMPVSALADPLLAAAVLPSSRATQSGNTVTAFATIINAGDSTGENCGITVSTALPISFSFQTTNSADNSLIGTANSRVTLTPGTAQSFVMSFTMTGAFASEDIQPVFSCSNGGTATVLSGINTILLTSSESGIPDMVTLAATFENSGYSEIEGAEGTGVFSVATSNVGEAGDVTVTADSGAAGPGVNILLCETDPITGQCTNPEIPASSVSTFAEASSTQTFAVFVQGNGQTVVDNAAVNRAFVRFESNNVTTGLTSVALRTVEQSTQPTLTTNIQVWANDGGDKVVQEDIRSFTGGDTLNATWNGEVIRTFGSRNEVVSFNVVVDNNSVDASEVAVEFSKLTNNDYTLETTNTSTDALFDWTERPIEVFAVGYLRIHGLSRVGYQLYDETHIPEAMRRPFQNFQPAAPAVGSGLWEDRPNHDKSYPDIAQPLEIRGTARVPSGNSQSFWVDVYLPKDAPAGVLTGFLDVEVDGVVLQTIPVEVLVADLTLPDERAAKTMVHMEGGPIVDRYFLGPQGGVLADDQDQAYRQVIDNHFKLAWRHGVSLIDLNQLVPDKQVPPNKPNEDWEVRLNGGLYTAAQGYDGPGQNLAHDVFSVGSYTSWASWWDLRRFDPEANNIFDPTAPLTELRRELEFRTDAWETWFQDNAPDTDRFLFVDDEPTGSFVNTGPLLPIEFANLVSEFVAENPGPGGNLDTFVTASPLKYDTELPTTSILAAVIAQGQTETWEQATTAINDSPDRRFFMYNGQRPASGTFVIEDDGVALRELAWGQYKLGISRWLYWNLNYWNNFLAGPATRNLAEVDPLGPQYRNRSQTNVFKSAHTFGRHDFRDPVLGEAGRFNYSNGDGVLMYPGTDLVFPAENRGIDGPIASLRLKHWRRGIQDVQYLAMAMEFDPVATQAIIDSIVPAVMWEIGVTDENDPSFVNLPPSWSNDPEVWERARAELINLLMGFEVVELSRF